MPNGGVPTGNGVKNPRPVTAKGEFLKTGQPGSLNPDGQTKDQMEVTEFGGQERALTPSPTKTQGSEVGHHWTEVNLMFADG